MPKGKFRFWDFDKKEYVYSDEVLQMSATDISTCGECELKFWHKITQEIKFPKNVYLVMGTAFHAVIENDLRYKVQHGANRKWEDIEKIFEVEWEKAKGNCNFEKSKLSELQAKIQCKNYVQIYSFKMSPMLYPLSNEGIEKFFRCFVNYQGKKLGITGKVDLLGKDLWLTDHKTTSSSWSQEEANKELQAYLYPWAIRNLGFEVQGFKFNVVNKSTVSVFPVSYNQQKVKEILIKAFDIKRKFEEGNIFRAKSARSCKFCEYGQAGICKEDLTKVSEQNVEDL